MSKDINNIVQQVHKNNQEVYDQASLNKEMGALHNDVRSMRKDIETLSSKIDFILELLNNLVVFIEEADEMNDEDNDGYESNEGWLPEVNNWEEKYLDDDDDDDEESDG